MRRPTNLATIAAAAVVMGACGLTTAAAGSSASPERRAQARQACADRWGWMRNSYVAPGTRAIITRTSPCKVFFDYGERGDGSFNALPCEVNRFGAFACAGHAHDELSSSTRWNATARRGGRLVLNRPPRKPRRLSRPDWLKRYPVVDGYIRPFDSRGRLRSGLSLHGSARPIDGCGVGRARSTRLSCVTGYTCFVAKLPLREGDRLACPDAPGSTRFRRGTAAGDS